MSLAYALYLSHFRWSLLTKGRAANVLYVGLSHLSLVVLFCADNGLELHRFPMFVIRNIWPGYCCHRDP